MVRVLNGTLLAGIIVFCWEAVAHMFLPIGTMGISVIPAEEQVLSAMSKSISEPGFYFFPGRDMGKTPTDVENKVWVDKFKKGPAGILVVRPQGGEPMAPHQLMIELATDIGAALIAALVLTQVRSGYAGRVLIVVEMALFALLSINVSYWNWYAFPTQFEIGEAIVMLAGGLLGGLVLAAFVHPADEGEKPKAA
jgi:hypothetical protein